MHVNVTFSPQMLCGDTAILALWGRYTTEAHWLKLPCSSLVRNRRFRPGRFHWDTFFCEAEDDWVSSHKKATRVKFQVKKMTHMTGRQLNGSLVSASTNNLCASFVYPPCCSHKAPQGSFLPFQRPSNALPTPCLVPRSKCLLLDSAES